MLRAALAASVLSAALLLERLGDALGRFLLVLAHLFRQLLVLRDVAFAAFSLSFFRSCHGPYLPGALYP